MIIDEIGGNIIEFPLFTEEFCSEILELAKDNGRWTTDRHDFYPTTDMLLKEIEMDEVYNKVINDLVVPLVCWYWKLEGDKWERKDRIDESFIVKYIPEEQAHLSLHHDNATMTCVVKLNNDFKGGGTYFPMYKTLVQPARIGHAFVHPSSMTHRHGARPVIEGERYVLVSFIQ